MDHFTGCKLHHGGITILADEGSEGIAYKLYQTLVKMTPEPIPDNFTGSGSIVDPYPIRTATGDSIQ